MMTRFNIKNPSIYCPHCRQYTALSVADTDHPLDVYAEAVWSKNDFTHWWVASVMLVGILYLCLMKEK